MAVFLIFGVMIFGWVLLYALLRTRVHIVVLILMDVIWFFIVGSAADPVIRLLGA